MEKVLFLLSIGARTDLTGNKRLVLANELRNGFLHKARVISF